MEEARSTVTEGLVENTRPVLFGWCYQRGAEARYNTLVDHNLLVLIGRKAALRDAVGYALVLLVLQSLHFTFSWVCRSVSDSLITLE